MGILKRLFGKEMEDPKKDLAKAIQIQSKYTQVAIRELAFELCVQRIAKTIARCEFRTFRGYQEEKAALYYALNIKPNPNQNSTEFWTYFITKLYQEGEAVILPIWDRAGTMYLYVADSYSLDDRDPLTPYIFRSVSIGNKTMPKSYSADDLYYFKLQNNRTNLLLNNTLAIYTDLIQTAYTSYKQANGSKYKMKIDTVKENDDEELDKILNEDMATFLKSDSAVFPQYQGYELEKLETGRTVTTTRDVKALLDDVMEITCKAFLIPTNIMTGEVADTGKAVDDFLTFCLDSLCELIEDELNRKTFKPEEYLKGSRIKLYTQGIRHIDPLKDAGNIDKLISSGVKTVNDINRMLSEPYIDEEWANTHYITKNYTTTGEMLTEQEGEKK